jgi:thiamine biosynthesis lipoprotein
VASVVELQFRAMGSQAHVIVVGDHPLLATRAQARIEELEARWSRFLPDSEVSALTDGAGRFVSVSDDTVLLVERSIEAWRLTGGAFDPTLLGALLRAGYDRSFDQLNDPGSDRRSALEAGCFDIEIRGNTVRLPIGVGFDPGGIGKGLAADLVADELMAAGAGGVCVNLGGDVRLAGDGPHSSGWTVSIEHPSHTAALATVGLTNGAMATSTTRRRRWVHDGKPQHHLIDPATGTPSATDVDQVTVIAAQAWRAEVMAKAVLLRGRARAFDLIDDRIDQALLVDHHGLVAATSGLAAYLGGRDVPDRVGEFEEAYS